MNTNKSMIAAITLVAAMIAPTTAASDTPIPVPAGWTPGTTVFAARGDNVAVALRPATGTHATRLMQYRGGAFAYTDFNGAIFGLAYSQDGQKLLVSWAGMSPEDEESTFASLVDAAGGIVWTLNNAKELQFSDTSETVFGWGPRFAPVPREVVVYRLDGTFKRRYTPDTTMSPSVIGAFVLGDGDRVAIALGMSVVGLAATPTTHPIWTLNLTVDDYQPDSLLPFDEQRILLKHPYGWFKLLDDAGAIKYDFDPEALASSDPTRNWIDYAQFRPFPTPDVDKLLLFDGTPQSFIVTVSTGAKAAFTVDLSAPAAVR